jgi:hypothetical protein
MLVRLKRFGIGEETFWEIASTLPGEYCRENFCAHLREMADDPMLVAATAAILHIADEVAWKLLPEDAGRRAVHAMMAGIPAAIGMNVSVSPDGLCTGNESIPNEWVHFVVWCIENGS